MSQNEELELVKVFQSDDLGTFLLAKTYLDSIEIPHLEKTKNFKI
ncbi:MAG: hypothetical protein WCO51_10390 [bacterium]